MKRRGFTLIELLVVVAIIAILIAILIPSLAKAKDRTKTVKCASIERSLYQAVQAYITDQDGFMMPMKIPSAKGGKYGTTWTGPNLLGAYWGKSSGSADVSGQSVIYLSSLVKTFRCQATEPSLYEYYKEPGGQLDNTIIINGISATDVDHFTYTYNANFGNGGTIKPTKFTKIPKTTLVALESHGGADKGEYDYQFDSVDRLTQMPSPAVVKGGWGLSPLAGHPHARNKNANLLFIDGQIIADDPFKLDRTSTNGWVVNWLLPQRTAFPFQ